MNKYTALIGFLSGLQESVRGSDEVLAYVYNNDFEGVDTRYTDIVNERRFGTGPTVFSKIKRLERSKHIKVVRSKDDGRAKVIQITSAGIDYLRGQDKRISEIIGTLA